MKKANIIILLILGMSVSAQNYNPFYLEEKNDEWRFKEAAITLAVNFVSVGLDAVGSSFIQQGRTEYGYMMRGMSKFTLVARPFLSNMNRNDWGWYISSYILLNMSVYENIHRLTGGTECYFTHLWGNTPKKHKLAFETLYFGVSVAIPLTSLKRKGERNPKNAPQP